MSSRCKFCYDDVVYRINKKQCVDVGRVIENSEFLSSDEDESYETPLKHCHRMKEGHIRVVWNSKRAQEVLPEEKVKLCDRHLEPCDVVRKVPKGKDTQYGYCRYTNVKADVLVVGTKQVIVGVDSRDLVPLEKFKKVATVFKDPWVGVVENMETELTLRCSDGSRCIMSDMDAFDMDDMQDRRDRASIFKLHKFYPGQQFLGETSCFQQVKWLVLNKALEADLKCPKKLIRTTVEKVKIVSLEVNWRSKAYTKEGNDDTERPKRRISGDDLKLVKMMNIFKPCRLQIGNKNHLVMKENYEVISLQEWKNRMFDQLTVSKCIRVNDIDSNVFSSDTENNSDFKDLSNEENGSSSCASSITSHSSASSVIVTNSYNPYYYATKIRKKMKSAWRYTMGYDMKERLTLIPGEKLVTEALITETKADVVWQDGSVEHNILTTSLHPVLDDSSYNELFPGVFVVHNEDCRTSTKYGVVKQVNRKGRTALVTWMKTYHDSSNPHPEILNEEEVSIYDIKKHQEFKYKPGTFVLRLVNSEDLNPSSTAGQVVDVRSNGQVVVSWVNGESSLCYPQELCRVNTFDPDDDSSSDEDIKDYELAEFVLEIDTGATNKEFNASVKELKKALKNAYQGDNKSKEESEEDNAINKEVEGTLKEFEKVLLQKPFQGNDQNEEKDEKNVRDKLLESIEKLRAGMARLEKVFTQNPTQQDCHIMRKLIELFELSRDLDQLLGTTYFHEKHLRFLVDSVVEKLKRRGQLVDVKYTATQSEEENVYDHENVSDCSKVDFDILRKSPSDLAPAPTDSFSCNKNNSNKMPLLSSISPSSSSGSEPPNLCLQLCTTLKSILLKAHKDAELQFGMPPSETNALLAAETEQNQKVIIKDSEANELIDDSIKEGQKFCSEQEPMPKAEDSLPCEPSPSQGEFSILESVPDNHKFKLSILQPTQPSAFFRTIKKEMNILKSSLPDGIVVKGYEDRIDLYSVLIKGPKHTPYEDGLFFFDFQFPADYPKVPPRCHYVTYCTERLNPNLYEGGKVCVSLLGTWDGKGTEMWNPETSNLLQVLISIQGLILVSEPYFNEPGYEKLKGYPEGRECSKAYNEFVVLKLIQAMSKLCVNPPEVFQEVIAAHFRTQAFKLVERLESWITVSEAWNTAHSTSSTALKETCNSGERVIGGIQLPEFPLIPASKGFCITLRKSLSDFRNLILSYNINLD